MSWENQLSRIRFRKLNLVFTSSSLDILHNKRKFCLIGFGRFPAAPAIASLQNEHTT